MNTLLRAANFLFGPEGRHDLCELADLFDSVERKARAKAFDEGRSAGYEDGYMAAVQNEVDEVFSETAEAVLDADYIPNFRVQTSEDY